MKAYRAQAALHKGLAHPVRLRILDILARSEFCVCHLTTVLGLRQPYVSQQLSALRDAGLVVGRREGTLMYYRLRDARLAALIALGRSLAATESGETPLPPYGEPPVPGCPCPYCQAATTGDAVASDAGRQSRSPRPAAGLEARRPSRSEPRPSRPTPSIASTPLPTPRTDRKGNAMDTVRRVLFLCTGNSCRSQMAEAIVNATMADRWAASSAGTEPARGVHPLAVRVLAELGIAHRGSSKSVEAVRGQPFDLVVTVCDTAAESCPVWLGPGRRVHLGFPDPAASGDGDEALAVFRRVRDDIAAAVPALLSAHEARRPDHLASPTAPDGAPETDTARPLPTDTSHDRRR